MSQILSVKSGENTEKGRGHATLHVEGKGLSGDNCRIVLARGSGARVEHLGAMGWQGPSARIIPDAVDVTPTGLVVHLGPAVVQHMQRGNYSLSVCSAGAESGAKAFAWTVAPFRLARGSLDKPVAIPVESENSGVRAEVDTVDASRFQPAAAPVQETAPTVTAPPPGGDGPVETTSTGTNGGNQRGVLIGVAALLVAAAVGAYFFLSGDTPEPGPGPVAEQLAPAPAAVSAVEAQDSQSETLTPEEEVRRFLATGPSPDAITEKGDEMLTRGHPGLALVLFRRAAEAGHTAALLAQARIYDPLHETSGQGMPAKAPTIAYELYRQAHGLGDGEARPAIERLKEWAVARAAEGDREASQLERLIALEN